MQSTQFWNVSFFWEQNMSRLRISPGLCLFASLVIPVYGQIDRGTIKGTVTDPQNATVAGAKITLSNPATGASLDTTTEAGGSFTFVGSE